MIKFLTSTHQTLSSSPHWGYCILLPYCHFSKHISTAQYFNYLHFVFNFKTTVNLLEINIYDSSGSEHESKDPWTTHVEGGRLGVSPKPAWRVPISTQITKTKQPKSKKQTTKDALCLILNSGYKLALFSSFFEKCLTLKIYNKCDLFSQWFWKWIHSYATSRCQNICKEYSVWYLSRCSASLIFFF